MKSLRTEIHDICKNLELPPLVVRLPAGSRLFSDYTSAHLADYTVKNMPTQYFWSAYFAQVVKSNLRCDSRAVRLNTSRLVSDVGQHIDVTVFSMLEATFTNEKTEKPILRWFKHTMRNECGTGYTGSDVTFDQFGATLYSIVTLWKSEKIDSNTCKLLLLKTKEKFIAAKPHLAEIPKSESSRGGRRRRRRW